MEKPYWEGKHYAFFSNKECEYFPCHAGADPEMWREFSNDRNGNKRLHELPAAT